MHLILQVNYYFFFFDLKHLRPKIFHGAIIYLLLHINLDAWQTYLTVVVFFLPYLLFIFKCAPCSSYLIITSLSRLRTVLF